MFLSIMSTKTLLTNIPLFEFPTVNRMVLNYQTSRIFPDFYLGASNWTFELLDILKLTRYACRTLITTRKKSRT